MLRMVVGVFPKVIFKPFKMINDAPCCLDKLWKRTRRPPSLRFGAPEPWLGEIARSLAATKALRSRERIPTDLLPALSGFALYPPVAGRPPGGLSGAAVGGVWCEAFFAEAKRSPELWIR